MFDWSKYKMFDWSKYKTFDWSKYKMLVPTFDGDDNDSHKKAGDIEASHTISEEGHTCSQILNGEQKRKSPS